MIPLVDGELVGTVVVAVAGLVTTGFAPYVTARAQTKSERKTARRDRTAAALTNGVIYAHHMKSLMDFYTDMYNVIPRPGDVDVPPTEILDARMRLNTSDATFRQWKTMRDGWEGLNYDVGLNGPRSGDPNGAAVNFNDTDVKALYASIEDFIDTAKGDIASL